MGSIRTRTLVLVLGLLAISMATLSWKSHSDAQHEIEELFDAQLAQTARLLEGMVERDMTPAARESLQQTLNQASSAREAKRPGHPYESKLAFQVLDDRARIVLQSASAPADLFAGLVSTLAVDFSPHGALPPVMASRLDGYHNVPIDVHRWRVFVLHDVRDASWIVVGEREDVRGELVGKIALRTLLPDVVGLPLLAVLMWVAIGWSLRPLKQMAALIKARNPDDLAPLVIGRLPRELEPMVAALNRLLQQLHALLEREKRFLADAAHELRTPLAVLRIHAQNALDAPDPADRAESLHQLVHGVDRSTRLVAQLLTLARLEPGTIDLGVETLDLHLFIRNELAEIIPLALERGQELTLVADETGNYRAEADRTSFAVLLQNLVGNAIQYTPEHGRLRVTLQAAPQSLTLHVEDSGPGVPDAMKARLFERFLRGETGTGAGLGLSIVQRVVELHGGMITLGDAELGGLDVRVDLPRHRHRDRPGLE
ncbi:ATP-binding protein [Aromatoleum aromaticum]|uniref:histidine kinase n=1 Tax=Aromatoleum aromaticum (strain DSM 19018 / LMG 30748 / EbN1) TaxID=76114 RepID=Q5NZ26_AROAE|nr:ATP-binding protein [Aromatoleum aromaticum]NMG55609.1 HAMP domain-containing protein [Aromatoleum aromaticum]CAI09688.1 Sensor histidine kinase [Aromatoleum aromaticum EbN1]